MRFGFNFFARDLRDIGSVFKLGEQQRFELMGLVDSPSLAFDPFAGLTLGALQTDRAQLGPSVLVPRTRHPLLIANLVSALEELAPGRTFLGLGTGNTGTRHAGYGPANLETLAATVDQVRRLVNGETVEIDGTSMTVKGGGKRVPILVAGSGPKTLRLAGRIADMVFVHVGVLPDAVANGLRWVRQGAEEVGRDPDTIECWVIALAAIADDRLAALDEVKGAAVAAGVYALRGDSTAKGIPPYIQAKAGELLRNYDFNAHLSPGRSPNYYLAHRLGIADYLLERYTIAGTVDDCRRKLEQLRDAGVRNVCFSFGAAPDIASSIRGFGEKVIPALTS